MPDRHSELFPKCGQAADVDIPLSDTPASVPDSVPDNFPRLWGVPGVWASMAGSDIIAFVCRRSHPLVVDGTQMKNGTQCKKLLIYV